MPHLTLNIMYEVNATIDCKQAIDEYIGNTDWRVRANSNTTYSNAGLVNNTAGKIAAKYWLSEVYSPEEGRAHIEGDYHIHDLDCMTAYCFTGDTKVVLLDGTTPSFKELTERYKNGEYFWVVSRDKQGGIVPGKAHHPRLIKHNAELMEITISGGAKIVCTPDHEFMLRDGSYRQAKDLCDNESLMSYNHSEKGPFYNHTVVSKKYLDYTEDVYCLTVDEHENFALEAGVFVHNCAGWNLRSLLAEGFNGVRSRVNSKPPRHLREALGQMANFLGILQSEWAGAQAFSSFDTFLAPYVFKDRISFRNLKKAIRSFVYNLNVPSRWGQCVKEEYKCLRGDGKWATHNELKPGDEIYVVDPATGVLKKDVLTHVNVFDAPEKMHRYYNKQGFNFEVTDNHRVIYKTGSNGFSIKPSSELINRNSPIDIPISAWGSQTPNDFFGNECERGCRSCKVEEVESSTKKVWCPTTNTGTFVCMTDEGYIFLTGNSPFTNVTIDWTVPEDLKEDMPLCGMEHLLYGINDAELIAKAKERGVENLTDMTYKHFQPEMNMIQKAYYEVMTEGDSTGQPFTFPIPTVNITEEFDWEGENVLTLFENAAKIGSSYFQNFVGSQYKLDENGNRVEDEEAYKPSAVRSMAFTPTQEFVYKDNEGRVKRSALSKIYEAWEANMATAKGRKYEFMFNGKFYPITEMFKIDYSGYDITKTIILDNGYSFGVSVDHKCLVYDPVKKKTYNKLSQDIVSGDLIPVASRKWDTPSKHGSYEAGKVIGYYLAEGWCDDCRVYFAININRKDIVNDIKTLFESLGIEVIVEKQNAVNIYKVTAYGSGAVAYVHQFVTGKTAKQKRLYKYTWNTSTAFRQGLFDGYVETDGCGKDSNVVAHTTNKDLCDDLICLASSLGIVLKFSVNKNNTRYFKADKSDKVTFTSYKLCRFTSTPKDGVYYIPVREVKDVTHTPQFVYNFTIGNDAHLVELSNGIISPQCCRLQLDLNELRKRGNGLFGSAESTGSIGVVTINLARLGYRFKGDKEGLYKELDHLMELAKSTLEKKRVFVTDMYNRGLYPYTKRYLPAGFRNHFSTIGVNGGNEMIRNFTNDEYDITTEWGRQFAEELLNHIRTRMKEFQNETGNLYNLEASPGEGATHRFAREDIKRYPDIIQAGCKEKGQIYYTNSTQLPSWYTEDLFMALKLQDKLQTRYTGGTTFHMYMSEMISSPEACRDIVRKVLTNFKMPYITVTPLFSVCDKHGYLKGRHDFCPLCDEEILANARKES